MWADWSESRGRSGVGASVRCSHAVLEAVNKGVSIDRCRDFVDGEMPMFYRHALLMQKGPISIARFERRDWPLSYLKTLAPVNAASNACTCHPEPRPVSTLLIRASRSSQA